MTVLEYAFWGLLGAVVYAAPRGLVVVSENVTKIRLIRTFCEFIVSLVVGAIGSAGFAEIVSNTLRQTGVADLRAIAVVLGMVANPIAPGIVHLIGEGFLRRLGAPIARERLPR